MAVLGKPEKISSQDQLDVKRYGVIVSCGHRRGLLLPDLDGVDTPGQQVDIARLVGAVASVVSRWSRDDAVAFVVAQGVGIHPEVDGDLGDGEGLRHVERLPALPRPG